MERTPSASIVRFYMQDEATLGGRTTSAVLSDVQDGPEDQYCAIGDYKVKKQNGDFDFEPQDFEGLGFGTINAFGVASSVMRMYSRDLHFFAKSGAFSKSLSVWKNYPKKLTIFPYHEDESMQNAFHMNSELHFYSFEMRDDPSKIFHTSHSFDIVAHETGHGVLYRLRPDFSSKHLHTRALNESFGDCTAMFAILNHPVLRHELRMATKDDLKQKSFLPTLCEAFGMEVDQNPNGLRNAQVLTSMENYEDDDDYHYLSQVFTGAIYDCLAEEFEIKLEEEDNIKSEDFILNEIGEDLRRTFLKAFLEAPKICALAEMSRLVVKHSSSYRIKECLNNAFDKRGVSEAWENTVIKKAAGSSICGTL